MVPMAVVLAVVIHVVEMLVVVQRVALVQEVALVPGVVLEHMISVRLIITVSLSIQYQGMIIMIVTIMFMDIQVIIMGPVNVVILKESVTRKVKSKMLVGLFCCFVFV